MKKPYQQLLSILLITLVLTLPFITSVSAAQINSVNGKGKDGLNGIIRSTDFLQIEVVATDDSAITPTRMRLGTSTSFDSCTSSANTTTCKVRFPQSGEQNFDPKALPFSVSLLDLSNATLVGSSGSVVVDNRKPTVSFGSFDGTDISNGDVTFSYTASDTACDDSSCASSCSGIKSIEFFTLDDSIRDTVSFNSRNCSISSTFVKSSSSFSSGSSALFARATDMTGLVSDVSSVSFTANTVGPTFLSNSFEILLKGMDLRHFKSGVSVPVTVRVNVTDSDLDINAIYSDLRELNPSDASLSHLKGSCTTPVNNASLCSFPITLKIDSAGVKQLRFNGSDTKGNFESITFTRTFSVDNNGPTITSISSTLGSSLSQDSDIKVSFSELGSGVSPSDFSIVVDGDTFDADFCVNSSCIFEDVSFSGLEALIEIEPTSSDLLGNRVSSFSQTLGVDSSSPSIRSIKAVGVGGLSGITEEFVGVGDRIALEVNVTEDIDISSATADLSDYIDGADSVSGSCSNTDGNTFICSFLSDPVENAANGDISITITDTAGNSDSDTITLRTYLSNNNATPNFWQSKVQCSPSVLDRSLGPLVNLRSYCTVVLEPRSGSHSLQTVSISLAGCTGDQSSVLQNSDVSNTRSGSRSPVIKLTLKKDALSINELKTTCTLNIHSLADGTITQNPEEEKASITLQFFNQPLGTLDKGVQSKIDEAMAATEGINGIIGKLNDFLQIAKKICMLISAFYGLVSTLYGVSVALKITTQTGCASGWGALIGWCGPNPLTPGAIACYGQQNAETAADTSWLVSNRFCKFVNCRWAPWILGDMQKFTSDTLNSIPGSGYLATASGQGFGGRITVEKKTTNSQGASVTQNAPVTNQEFKNRGALDDYTLNSGIYQPDSTLVTSIAFACIPGIIQNLDKFRQIDCLYADCLQSAVKEDNVPISSCENLKSQATCKYVMGEVFSLIPYAVFMDRILGLIKKALSDPFSLIGAVIGATCYFTCPSPEHASYQVCTGAKLFAKVGEVIKEVQSILSQGLFENRQDYCKRLEQNSGNAEKSGGFLGL